MSIGLVGKKLGMTRIFQESGEVEQVTVIQIEPNIVSQLKTKEKDGYSAVQLAVGTSRRRRRSARLTKARAGHFAKANITPGRLLKEFRLEDEVCNLKVGDSVGLTIFQENQLVDITSFLTKGKGTQGGVKRHNFRMQDATHGNSISHRVLGSTGQRQSPGRVFKGKKMPGRMGAVRRTLQNLKIVKIDLENSLLIVKGGIPGAKGGDVIVQSAVKGN